MSLVAAAVLVGIVMLPVIRAAYLIWWVEKKDLSDTDTNSRT